MLFVDLNKNLHDKLKIYTATNRITIKKFINDIVDDFFKKYEEEEDRIIEEEK